MQSVKVVLINLTKPNTAKGSGLEALGIETVAGHILGKFGPMIKVRLFDAQLDSISKIISKVRNFNPDLVGISVNIGAISAAGLITKKLTKYQNPKIVFGARGAEFYPDYLPCPIRTECFIASGWGEIALEDIVSYMIGKKDLKQIRNILKYSSPDSNLWQSTPWSKQAILDLRKSFPPYRANLDRYRKHEMVTMETQRGCPYAKCYFCPRPHSLKEIHIFPIEKKLRELVYLSKKKVRSIPIIDEEFFLGKNGISKKIKLIEGIIKYKNRGQIHPDLNFCVDMRADTICTAIDEFGGLGNSSNPLNLLKSAGVKFIFVGIESLSQGMLDHLNKGTTVEQNVRAVTALREVGIKFQAGSLSLAPLMRFNWLKESVIRIRQQNLAELADPSLPLILFSTSEYYKRYFVDHKDNQELLDLTNKNLPALDTLSGIPYKYKDPKVQIIAGVHDFHEKEMYLLMKKLRSINAKLVYGGEEKSDIYMEIWKWLSYGRLEIILWGMEELCGELSKTDWRKTISIKHRLIFKEMQRRKQYMATSLLRFILRSKQSLNHNQKRLVEVSDLLKITKEVTSSTQSVYRFES